MANLLFCVVWSGWLTSWMAVAQHFREFRSLEQRLYMLIGSSGGAIQWVGYITHVMWVAFNAVRGDQHRKCYLIAGAGSGLVYAAEVPLRLTNPFFFVVVLAIMVIILNACFPGGPRKSFAWAVCGPVLFFQCAAWAASRFLPLILAVLPSQAGSVAYPVIAWVYEVAFMPYIFWVWRRNTRGDCNTLVLVFLLACVRYCAEGLYFAGILQSVSRHSDAEVGSIVATSILFRGFTKFLGRVGAWDALRGAAFGTKFNDMTAERDLIGRLSTSQCWIGFFLVSALATHYLCHWLAGTIEGHIGDPRQGGVFHRNMLWPCLILAALLNIVVELIVSTILWTQRMGTSSSASLVTVFFSMHKPGMQVRFGQGHGYSDTHIGDCTRASPGAIEVSEEKPIDFIPRMTIPHQMVLLVPAVYFSFSLAALPTYINLMQ
jgi:hypothetical protein